MTTTAKESPIQFGRLVLAAFICFAAIGAVSHFNNSGSVAVDPVAFARIHVAAPTATEPSPNGFRKINWGAKPSASMKKKFALSEGVTMYVPWKAPAPLFDVPVAEEAYSFVNGKLYSGMAWLDGLENHVAMKDALTKAYGQPTFVNEEQKIWRWKWLADSVEISLSYQPNLARTTVAFTNEAI